MGLFTNPKHHQQALLPNLQIQLSRPDDTVYKPADTITGTITVSSPTPITPRALEVSLWGHSSTWIRRSRHSTNSTTGRSSTTYYHYRDEAPLFTVSSNVFNFSSLQGESGILVPNQTYTYFFTFVVPEGTAMNRTGCYQRPEDPVYVVGSHALPPTFEYQSKMRPDSCSVSYGVTARLIPFLPNPGPSNYSNIDNNVNNNPIDPASIPSITAPILFTPLNPNAHIHNPPLTRYSKKLSLSSSILSSPTPTSLSFRQKLHDKLSSSTPKLDFFLSIDLPSVMSTGQQFQFRTLFAVLSTSSNVSHIPPITFKIVKLELKAFTFFRAPRDREAANTRDGEIGMAWLGRTRLEMGFRGDDADEVVEEKTVLNSVPDQAVIALLDREGGEDSKRSKSAMEKDWRQGDGGEYDQDGEKKYGEGKEKGEKVFHPNLRSRKSTDNSLPAQKQANECEAWFTSRIPGYMPPGFRSFAITRAYRVKVKIQVELCGKSFSFEVEGPNVLLGSA